MVKKNVEELIERLVRDPPARRKVTRESLWWFLHIFLGHYLKYQIAPFQEEMIHIAENERYERVAVMAFRGSGKSTILNLAYPLWAILGRQKKKYVVIISNSQEQARNHFANIKRELESNDLLKHDLGPFRQEETPWGAYSLELQHHGAKIMSVSRGQSIRGIRNGEYRPDLVILDDIEDTNPESGVERENLYAWYMNEVVPLGAKGTRYIVLGNLTHEESLIMRLRQDIQEKKGKRGVFRAYPFLDEIGKSLWPHKFCTEPSIEEVRQSVYKETWQREYLLRIVPEMTIILDDEDGEWKNSDLPSRQRALVTGMKKYRVQAPYIQHCAIIRGRK